MSSSDNTLGYPAGLLAPQYTANPYWSWAEEPAGMPDYLNLRFLTEGSRFVSFESGSGITNFSAQTFNSLILHRQGPYGWPSWKQIRGGNHPIVREQNRKGEWSYVLPDADELVISSSSGVRTVRPQHGNIHHFQHVSPVTTKYQPLRSSLSVATPIRNKFGKTITRPLPIDILTSFGNEMSYFNLKKIDQHLNLFKTTPAVYEEVKGMFTRGALETSISPVTEIKKFEYSEVIYPTEEMMYSKEAREKIGYTNNFWRGLQSERVAETPYTIHGKATYGKLAGYSAAVGHPVVASIWPLDTSTGSLNNLVDHTLSPSDQRFYLRWGHVGQQSHLFGAGEGELINRWSYPLKWSGGKYTHSTGSFNTRRLQPEAGPQYALPQMLHATSSISSPTQPPLVTSSGSRGQEILGIRATEDAAFILMVLTLLVLTKMACPKHPSRLMTTTTGLDTFQFLQPKHHGTRQP